MDVCAKIRGILHERRVGHGGTLDPMATGVLPVFVGQATKAVEFAEQSDKEYIAGLKLGVVTNTQDTSGEVLEERPVQAGRERLEAALARFRGEILQVPPMYSAIKINGQRLYELARRGREVERPARPVTIKSLELLDEQGENLYTMRVRCSKGTYIRTLCHDIGQARVEALLRPVDSLFAQYPALTVRSPGQEKRVRCGNPVTLPGTADGTYRVYGQAGDFLCLSRARGGALTAVKNFF